MSVIYNQCLWSLVARIAVIVCGDVHSYSVVCFASVMCARSGKRGSCCTWKQSILSISINIVFLLFRGSHLSHNQPAKHCNKISSILIYRRKMYCFIDLFYAIYTCPVYVCFLFANQGFCFRFRGINLRCKCIYLHIYICCHIYIYIYN